MLTLPVRANASVPTPPSGYTTTYFSLELGQPAFKDDTGVVHSLTGATGAQGVPGLGPVIFQDEDREEPIFIPGPKGEKGDTGAAGSGSNGSVSTIILLNDFEIEDPTPQPLGMRRVFDIIDRQVANASSSIILKGITDIYDYVILALNGMLPATSGGLPRMRVTTGGGTPDTGANYSYDFFGWRAAGSVLGGAQSGSDHWKMMSEALGISNSSSPGHGISGTFFLHNPTNTSDWKQGDGKARVHDSTNVRATYDWSGTYEATTAVDGWQFYFSSGNITRGIGLLIGARSVL